MNGSKFINTIQKMDCKSMASKFGIANPEQQHEQLYDQLLLVRICNPNAFNSGFVIPKNDNCNT